MRHVSTVCTHADVRGLSPQFPDRVLGTEPPEMRPPQTLLWGCACAGGRRPACPPAPTEWPSRAAPTARPCGRVTTLFLSPACVNCVRWSNGGMYLASGGDDKLIMVWKRAT